MASAQRQKKDTFGDTLAATWSKTKSASSTTFLIGIYTKIMEVSGMTSFADFCNLLVTVGTQDIGWIKNIVY